MLALLMLTGTDNDTDTGLNGGLLPVVVARQVAVLREIHELAVPTPSPACPTAAT